MIIHRNPTTRGIVRRFVDGTWRIGRSANPATKPCCCTTPPLVDCPVQFPNSECNICNVLPDGTTPAAYTVVVSGVSVCGPGCYLRFAGPPNATYWKLTDTAGASAFNGTRCFTRGGGSTLSCVYTAHATTPETLRVYGDTFPGECNEDNFGSSQSGYRRLLTVEYSGGLITYTLQMSVGTAVAGEVFFGSVSVAPPDPNKPCYTPATIVNTYTQVCTPTIDRAGGGGSATITPCC